MSKILFFNENMNPSFSLSLYMKMSNNAFIIIIVFVCISNTKKNTNKPVIFKFADYMQSSGPDCLGILKKFHCSYFTLLFSI